jgi:hypothetical protein
MPAMKEIARNIMEAQVEDKRPDTPLDRVTNAVWFERVSGVLGWKLQ